MRTDWPRAVPATAVMLLIATMETFIGLALVTGRFLRTGLVVLAGALVGIMSPVVLSPVTCSAAARP